MSKRPYDLRCDGQKAFDKKIRTTVRTKSPDLLEQEARDAEREAEITALLRAAREEAQR